MSRVLVATITTLEDMLLEFSARPAGLGSRPMLTNGHRSEEANLDEIPWPREPIHTLDDCGTGCQIHPLGFHRLIKLPRPFINGGRRSLTRICRPFKVTTDCGARFRSMVARRQAVQGQSTLV